MLASCDTCGKKALFTIEDWRCECGGAWEVAELPDFDPARIREDDFSIWRYGHFLGLDMVLPQKHMGVGWTPLVPISLYNRKCHIKLEYLEPSGSFKDRGVNAMVNQLYLMGAKTVIEDSSGNAGASLAAHAARFGIPAEIFVPEHISIAKRLQIGVYGATVIPVSGPRSTVEEAAQETIGHGRAYASHAYNAAYLAGQTTSAFELWEQLDRRAPDWILIPTGQGGQFLGYWFGFRQLLKAGLIERLPRLVAVQAARVAPIHHAWTHQLDHIPEVISSGSTSAEGVAISKPVRDKRILQALTESNGQTLSIGEAEIVSAYQFSARLGYFIEPTSALVFAGLAQVYEHIGKDEDIVLSLTGSGLKGAL